MQSLTIAAAPPLASPGRTSPLLGLAPAGTPGFRSVLSATSADSGEGRKHPDKDAAKKPRPAASPDPAAPLSKAPDEPATTSALATPLNFFTGQRDGGPNGSQSDGQSDGRSNEGGSMPVQAGIVPTNGRESILARVSGEGRGKVPDPYAKDGAGPIEAVNGKDTAARSAGGPSGTQSGGPSGTPSGSLSSFPSASMNAQGLGKAVHTSGGPGHTASAGARVAENPAKGESGADSRDKSSHDQTNGGQGNREQGNKDAAGNTPVHSGGPLPSGAAINLAAHSGVSHNPGAANSSASNPVASNPGAPHSATAQGVMASPGQPNTLGRPSPGGGTSSASSTPSGLAAGAENASSSAAGALQAVHTARLIQTANQSEMRVGMHSPEFGDISIQATVKRDQMAARISVENGELGKELSLQLPAMQAALDREHGMHSHIDLLDHSSAPSHNGGGTPSSEQRDAANPQGSNSSGANPSGQNPPGQNLSGANLQARGPSAGSHGLMPSLAGGVSRVAGGSSLESRLDIRV